MGAADRAIRLGHVLDALRALSPDFAVVNSSNNEEYQNGFIEGFEHCQETAIDSLLNDSSQQHSRVIELLERIERAEGAYSASPLKWAENCIESMKADATAALALLRGEPRPAVPALGTSADVKEVGRE